MIYIIREITQIQNYAHIHTPVLYSKLSRCYLRYYTDFAIIAEVRFIRDSVMFIIFSIFNGSVMNRALTFLMTKLSRILDTVTLRTII